MGRKVTVPLRISSQNPSGSRASGNRHPSPTIAISKPPPDQPADPVLRPFDALRQGAFRKFPETFWPLLAATCDIRALHAGIADRGFRLSRVLHGRAAGGGRARRTGA